MVNKDDYYVWKIFEVNHRWHHCNADNFKMLKANCMLIRLLYANRMFKYVGKISL